MINGGGEEDYRAVAPNVFQLPRPSLELVENNPEAAPEEAAGPSEKTRRSQAAAVTEAANELRRGCSKKTAPAAPESSYPSPKPRKVPIQEGSEETKSEDLSVPLEERVMRRARDDDHAKDLEEALSRFRGVKAAGSSTPSASGSASDHVAPEVKDALVLANAAPLEATWKPAPRRPRSHASIDRSAPKQPDLAKPKPSVESATTAPTSAPTAPKDAKAGP